MLTLARGDDWCKGRSPNSVVCKLCGVELSYDVVSCYAFNMMRNHVLYVVGLSSPYTRCLPTRTVCLYTPLYLDIYNPNIFTI